MSATEANINTTEEEVKKVIKTLEEDDEFEDFPEDATFSSETKVNQDALWEEDWDDDDTQDKFSQKLREELKKSVKQV